MPIDRRSFLANAAATAGFQAASMRGAPPSSTRAPPVVRADFPHTGNRIYLNSAYIAPVHRAVIEAGRKYIEAKSGGALQVAGLMSSCDAVRAQFAHLVKATPDEIGLLFSTGDGENVIANGIG